MRIPLGATQDITLTHTVRHGTASESYTVVLSGVSCHEAQSAKAENLGFARQGSTAFCIFPEHATALCGGAEKAVSAGDTFLSPAAFKAADTALRGVRWTLALEDKALLPDGRTAVVTSIVDNRSGRCPHWYVEVSG